MKGNNINFYWFSGTGNTLTAVKAMRKVFEDAGKNVNLFRIEKTDPESVDLSGTIGIGITVAEQGTFPFIWDFLKAMPESKGTEVFFVDTMWMYSGGIIGPVGKILKKKGYKLLGAKEIIMPNNLLKSKFQPEKDLEKIDKGRKKAALYADKLLADKGIWIDIPVYSYLMGLISKNAGTWAFMRKSVPMKIDHQKCTRCSMCIKLCPVSNIAFSGEKREIELYDKCQLCLRCFTFCPAEAISYGKKDYIKHKGVDVLELLK